MEMCPSYTLESWQSAAVAAWKSSRHPERGTHHGIPHVHTGAGKSVLSAAAMVEAARSRPETKFAAANSPTSLRRLPKGCGSMLGLANAPRIPAGDSAPIWSGTTTSRREAHHAATPDAPASSAP